MPFFPSDFKKFKHKASDDKMTTLEHEAGHTVTIYHKALSPSMRKQLEALIPKETGKQDTELHAEGGMAGTKRSGALGTMHKVDQDIEDSKNRKASHIPNDGKDVRTPEQKARAAEYERTGRLPEYAEGGSVSPEQEEFVAQAPQAVAETTQLDPATARKREIYNNLSNYSTIDPKSGVTPTRLPSMFGPNGEEPQEFNPRAWALAEQKYSSEEAENAAKTAASQQEAIALNQARTAAGLSPIAVPSVPNNGPTPSLGLAAEQLTPQAGMQDMEVPADGSPNPSSMLQSGYDKQQQAIQMQANAQTALAQDQLTALKASYDAQTAVQNQYKQDFDALDAERKNLIMDIQEGHIDPNKFWTGDKNGNGGHSRMAAAIGIILAGFNPTNSPNAAISYLNKQMEANLDAQKANMQSKQNLLSLNMRQFGNLQDAMNMTRVMQADMVKNQLEQAAAKATSPLAKAAAMQAAGELDKQYAPLFQSLATKTTLSKLTAQANQDPNKLPQMIDAIAAVDPERAKEMRGRMVPGVGLANSMEGAKTVNELKATTDAVKEGLVRLKEITKGGGKSLSPSARAEADTIRTSLIGRLRVPMTGPGAMSEGERQLLMDMIPSATDFFSLDSRTLTKLNTIDKLVNTSLEKAAQANGMQYKAKPLSQGMTPEVRSKAEAWAKASPNDPRAAQILQKLGK